MPRAHRKDLGPDRAEARAYLFDMLSQMAKMAAACGEPGIELILTTIVVSRDVDFETEQGDKTRRDARLGALA